MDEKKSLKPMPKGVESVLVTKQAAAKSQLETAIWLWFNEFDPVSIHALAVAAHDCFDALVSHSVRKRSGLQTWLDSQSKERRKHVRFPQNFFKHGARKLTGQEPLHTIESEVFMMDASNCYEMLHGKLTPLMRLYQARFLYEHPALITEDALPAFAKNSEIHQLANSSRKEFFQRVYPFFVLAGKRAWKP